MSRILSFFLPPPPRIEPGEEVVLVDVRTPAEWAREHVVDATLIPHHQMATRWKELREHRKKRILVYCRTGSRSAVATRVLREKGFDQVENAGGIGALKRAGLETKRGG